MTESHLIQVQDDADMGTCIDESACDHFCHISSHMLGFISQTPATPTAVSGTTYITSNQPFHSSILSPPFQPPKA